MFRASVGLPMALYKFDFGYDLGLQMSMLHKHCGKKTKHSNMAGIQLDTRSSATAEKQHVSCACMRS